MKGKGGSVVVFVTFTFLGVKLWAYELVENKLGVTTVIIRRINSK